MFYPVMEISNTIQGEGFHQGKAATFVRLAGCNIGCFWCDVPESWSLNSSVEWLSATEIQDKISEYETKLVVITGGEPMMYNLNELTKTLHQGGFLLNLETSGAYEISGQWDWICVSPKKFKPPTLLSLQQANELKVIVYNKSDYAFGTSFISDLKAECHLYLQPEESQYNKMIPNIIEYIKGNMQWRLSLQIHKTLNIP